MADIYDLESGVPITEGLQGCQICDEALNAAQRIASEDGPVILEDDDGTWLVHEDGHCLPFNWPDDESGRFAVMVTNDLGNEVIHSRWMSSEAAQGQADLVKGTVEEL